MTRFPPLPTASHRFLAATPTLPRLWAALKALLTPTPPTRRQADHRSPLPTAPHTTKSVGSERYPRRSPSVDHETTCSPPPNTVPLCTATHRFPYASPTLPPTPVRVPPERYPRYPPPLRGGSGVALRGRTMRRVRTKDRHARGPHVRYGIPCSGSGKPIDVSPLPVTLGGGTGVACPQPGRWCTMRRGTERTESLSRTRCIGCDRDRKRHIGVCRGRRGCWRKLSPETRAALSLRDGNGYDRLAELTRQLAAGIALPEIAVAA